MKGQITGKVINVFPIDSLVTANGGTFNKRTIWVMDDITNSQYPNYYVLEFSGQAVTIPDAFSYLDVYMFDIEVSGRKYVKPGTQVESIFTTLRSWRATPVNQFQPQTQQPAFTPQQQAAPAGFVPANAQQAASAATFMPNMNQPGGVQTGGFQPAGQQNMGAANGLPANTGHMGNGFNQAPVNTPGNGFGQPATGFNQPAGTQNNGFTQQPAGGFQQNNQPAVNNGFNAPAQNNGNVADDLPF